jgi:hypothetical protein
MLFGKPTLTKLTQLLNALEPMLVTLFGMIILIKLEQFSNAFEPILITLYTFDKYVIVEGIIKFQFGGGTENPVTEAFIPSKKVYITF